MSNDKIPGIPEEFEDEKFEEIAPNDDINLDDLPDIIEDDFPKFSNYVDELFSLTGRRDCAPVTVAQIKVLRALGRQTLRQEFGDHCLLILHDDLFQQIFILISKIKDKPHYALMLTDQGSALRQ